MANIIENLKKILTARYGKDVRQAIHDSISDMNAESTTAISKATNAESKAITAQNSAVNSAQTAEYWAKKSQSASGLVVDESLNPNSLNPIANKPVAHLKNGSSNINTIGLEVGSLNSGGSPIADSAKMRMTAMLEIKPNTTYTWSNKNNVDLRYVTHFYDATGTHIANSRVYTTTFTTPSDAKYIRTRTENATIDLTNLWKLEEGSIVTPYEPYYEGTVELTQKIEQLKNGSKNLLDLTAINGSMGGISYVVNANKSITVSGTRTTSDRFLIGTARVESGKTYRVSAIGNFLNMATVIVGNTSGTQYVNAEFDQTFTATSNETVTVYAKGTANGAVASGTAFIQLEEGNTTGAYEPYYKGNVELTSEVNEMSTNIDRIDGLLPKHFSMGGSKSFNIKHDGYLLLMTDRGGMWFEGTNGRTLSVIQTSAQVTVSRINNTNLKITNGSTYATTLFYISDKNVEITETT